MTHSHEIVGIGNALMDFTVDVPDEFLEKITLKKSTMTLVDQSHIKDILDQIGSYEVKKSSGGSAGNTMKDIAYLGGKSAFIAKVGKDDIGSLYKQSLESAGVTALFGQSETNTGVALTFITPDHERTFATYLGAALDLRAHDVSEDKIRKAKILHVEGFVLDTPEHQKAALYAMDIAKKNNVKISIDLADVNIINRNKPFLENLVSNYASIVFANEKEAAALTGDEPQGALDKITSDIVVIKLGAQGSIIREKSQKYFVEPFKVHVVNTNGAGDAYSAGFLNALVNGHLVKDAGKIGSYVASRVVGMQEATLNSKLEIDLNSIKL